MGVGIPAVTLTLYGFLCVPPPWNRHHLAAHVRWLRSREYRRRVELGVEPMPALWLQMKRMRLGSGLLLFFAIAGPWYGEMIRFHGVDSEGKTFFQRFFIHDHFERLATGVHTTTPGGTFAYFIEQGGYGIFPWIALVPGALMLAGRSRFRSTEPRSQLSALSLLWAGFAFALVASSAPKFHHYSFPPVPPLAILLDRFAARLG